ncbi:hypothetical protein BH10PSE7_BH10PSE7_31940 [soil metagenome]
MALKTGDGTDNKLVCTASADVIYGFGGFDTLTGGAGSDSLFGNSDNDHVAGGAGNDFADGGEGNDSVDGGTGNDLVTGGAGLDYLTGGAGNDIVNGGEGSDTILGGAGADILQGGSDADFFQFAENDGLGDVIVDFKSKDDDKINLFFVGSGLTFQGKAAFTGADQVRYSVSHGDATVQVNLDADKASELTIKLIHVSALHESDFIL